MEHGIEVRSIYPKLSKLKKTDVKYYLFFIILEFGEAINKGSDNKIFLAFSLVGFLFLIYKLINSKYEFRELFIIITLGVLGILIFYQTNKAGGFLSVLALIGLKGVDIKKLMKLCFWIRLSAFLLLFSLSSFDIIENTMITHLRGEASVIRYSMGFSHPNQFHLSFIILLLLFMYIYYEKLNLIHLFLLGIVNISVYARSYSRTSTIIGFFAIAIMIWFKSNHLPRLKNAFCFAMVPFGFLISIIPAVFYNNIPNLRTIDRLMQWRITFSKYYLDTYSIRLFGNNLNFDPIVLDSGYVELILNYGLIFTTFYVVANMVIIYRYVKMKKYRELLLIISLSIYGITESFIPNLFSNVSLIFLGELIFEKYKIERALH